MAISTGTAILGAAAIGGLAQGRASSKASKAQAQAGREAIFEQRQARGEAQELAQPFVDLGVQAGGQLQNFLADPTAGLAEINPIVDILRRQGFEQIQESAAAQGRLGAGGTLQDLTQFSSDLATTAVPQLQNQRFNQLFNVASLGQNAAAGQGTQALQTASNVGNLLGNIGQAQAQGAISQGQAITGTLQNVAGAAGAFPNLFGGGTPPPATGGLAPGAFDTRQFGTAPSSSGFNLSSFGN